MHEELNTPKWDLWYETADFIRGFSNHSEVQVAYTNGLELQQLVTSGYGADPNETQADRETELENCISFDYILKFHKELSEKVSRIEDLIKRETEVVVFYTTFNSNYPEPHTEIHYELHELGAGGISEMKASREFNHPVLQIMYKLDFPTDCQYVVEELTKEERTRAESYLDHKLTINPKDR